MTVSILLIFKRFKGFSQKDRPEAGRSGWQVLFCLDLLETS